MHDYIYWKLMQRPTSFLARCAAHREHTQKIEQEIKDIAGLVGTGILVGYVMGMAILTI